jgi:hypothetical protein
MKVYFYDRESGIYQGEEFVADVTEVEDGGATVMAPPSCEKGFVPRFDEGGMGWIMTSHTSERLTQLRSVCHTVKSAT